MQTVRKDLRYNLGFDGRKKGWTVGPCFGLRTHSWCMGSPCGGRVELAGHGEPRMACRFGCPTLSGLLRSPGTHLRARNQRQGPQWRPLRWPFRVIGMTSPCWWGVPSKASLPYHRTALPWPRHWGAEGAHETVFYLCKDAIHYRALDSYIISYDLEKLYRYLFLYHYLGLK